MQVFMRRMCRGAAFKVLFINFVNGRIVLRFTQSARFVGLIQPLRAQLFLDQTFADRLAGAADAAHRAGHDFDQIVFAGAVNDFLCDFARIGQSVNDRQSERSAV